MFKLPHNCTHLTRYLEKEMATSRGPAPVGSRVIEGWTESPDKLVSQAREPSEEFLDWNTLVMPRRLINWSSKLTFSRERVTGDSPVNVRRVGERHNTIRQTDSGFGVNARESPGRVPWGLISPLPCQASSSWPFPRAGFSTLAPGSNPLQYSCWKIRWTEEPRGLQSMRSRRLDTTEQLHFHFSLSRTGEGNGSPHQCFCLENPRDGGAWWAAVYGVAQSQTRLMRLSSSSSSSS